MKSCCSNCKQNKPCCGTDMGPGPLNGIFRRSIGYGAYTFGDEPKVAPATPAAPPIIVVVPDKILGLDRKTIFYILGSIAVYKLLF